MMRSVSSWKIVALLLGAAALIFGYFIWPTPWEYRGGNGDPLLRVLRATGRVERYTWTDTGWADARLYRETRINEATGGTDHFTPDSGWVAGPRPKYDPFGDLVLKLRHDSTVTRSAP